MLRGCDADGRRYRRKAMPRERDAERTRRRKIKDSIVFEERKLIDTQSSGVRDVVASGMKSQAKTSET